MARLLDEFPDMVLVLSASGTLLWANQTAEKLFERTMEEAVGIEVYSFVHPDDLGIVERSFETIQSKDVGNPIEIRVKTASGWRLVELIGVPVSWYEEGAILVGLRDLTDRRRFELAHNDVARFRSLVHRASIVVLLLSRDGEIESASGALIRMLGHDPEQIEHARFINLVASEDRESFDAMMKEVLADSSVGAITKTIRLLHFEGRQLIPFEMTIVNFLDDPTIQGLVLTAHDVSERVSAESELNAALDKLHSTFSLLSATLEATADGLLVVDQNLRITSSNRRFLDLLKPPEDIWQAQDLVGLSEHIAEQVEDPEGFRGRAREIFLQRDAESSDTLVFLDGRVLRRSSKPQYVDGEVVGRVWSFSDITEQHRLEQQLEHLAFHDALTGLPNRSLFNDRLDQAIARCQRNGMDLAVLFIDIDDFKTVNDGFGHSTGDELLVEMSGRLLSCLRVSDSAARLGGDEFAVLVEDVEDHEDVLSLSRRIMEVLRRPVSSGNRRVNATVSIGVTFGASESQREEMLRNADLAMYLAKTNGKDRIEEYEDRFHSQFATQLQLEADLREAIRENAFTVHYQPIVDLRSNEIKGFEALVRWEHPTNGLLHPAAFVPFAEEIGLIDAIDLILLREASSTFQHWQEIGIAPMDLLLSVNLPASVLENPSIGPTIVDVVESYGLSPSNLILEITDNTVKEDVTAAERHLSLLKDLGFKLAIDDFGNGYSSFSHLERLPIDILKIDPSYVMTTKEGDVLADFAKAIVQLCAIFGLQAIAEGVESAPQAARLLEIGCKCAQGYHLGVPLDAHATEELLRSRLITS
jgi:diguanylate cyclase (GGDEF)-like protein/PAS domain S-box-containing protein